MAAIVQPPAASPKTMSTGMDRASIDSVIEQHMPLAHQLAAKFAKKAGKYSDLDDLVGEALLALVSVTKTFEFDRGASFTTYAYRCIWYSLCEHLRRETRCYDDERNRAKSVERMFNDIAQREHREPTTAELEALVPGYQLDRMRVAARAAASTEAFVQDPASDDISVADAAIARTEAAIIRKSISTMKPREAYAFTEVTIKGRTSTSVARDMNICRASVNNNLQRARVALRKNLAEAS